MTARVATVPPRSRRAYPPIASLADLAAALQREAIGLAVTGEPADLADDVGAACYPVSVAARLGAALADVGRGLADRVTIADLDDGGALTCTLAAFAVDNREDVALVASVIALEPGAALLVGGGAAPLVSIRREARP